MSCSPEAKSKASTFPPMLAANCSTALGRAVPHSPKRARALRVLGAAVLLAGCAGRPGLMPTPRIYTGAGARPLFTGPPPPTTSVDLLYVTDRVPVTTPDGSLAYSSDRSRSMAFGSVTVDIGEQVPWPVLAQQSTESKRELPLELRLGAVTELGRFPPIPYDVDPVPGGITRSSATVDVHQRAAAGLQERWRGASQPRPGRKSSSSCTATPTPFRMPPSAWPISATSSAASSYAGSSAGRPADRAG